jgi:hypothetical protein
MVIQTHHKTYNKTPVKDVNSVGWVAIDDDISDGFVITIKPTHILSAVLLSMTCHIGMDYDTDSRWWGIQLYRKIGDGAWVSLEDANGLNNETMDASPCWISHNMGADNSMYSHSIINVSGTFEDIPSTTSNVYYTAYWKSKLNGEYGRLYLNRPAYVEDGIINSSNYPITSSSWTASEIWNTGTPYLPKSSAIIITDDKVGIGTSPDLNSINKLDVLGNINITTSAEDNYKITINNRDIIGDTSNFIISTSNLLNSDYISRDAILIELINSNYNTLSNYLLNTNNQLASSDTWNKAGDDIYNKNTGAVGIGTSVLNLNNKLEVGGNINIQSGNKYKINNIDLAFSNLIGIVPTERIPLGNNMEIDNNNRIAVNLSLYNGSTTINGDLVVNSNLIVNGETTQLFTNVYSTEKLDIIFQRFARLGHEETRSAKGVGLGLYIVKELIRAMRGEIKAENVSGGGLRFRIQFNNS